MNHVDSTDNSPSPVSRVAAAQLPRMCLSNGIFRVGGVRWCRSLLGAFELGLT